MTKRRYEVTYTLGNTRCTRTLYLYGGMESEALQELRRLHSTNGHDPVILRIVPE